MYNPPSRIDELDAFHYEDTMKNWIPRVLVLALVWQVCPVRAGDTAVDTAKVDKLVSQYSECCGFTGTVLVSEHDKVIFKKG